MCRTTNGSCFIIVSHRYYHLRVLTCTPNWDYHTILFYYFQVDTLPLLLGNVFHTCFATLLPSTPAFSAFSFFLLFLEGPFDSLEVPISHIMHAYYFLLFLHILRWYHWINSTQINCGWHKWEEEITDLTHLLVFLDFIMHQFPFWQMIVSMLASNSE